ncbi:hypothetical protein D3C85_786190 [compost metagenome]
MSGGVFGHGLDADVYAVFERAEGQACRPGVVHHRQHAARLAGLRQSGNIDDLERQRGWGFDQQQPGLFAAEREDFRGRGVCGVKPRGDAACGQVAGQKAARGAIDGVAGHDFVARTQQGQQGHGDGGEA